MLRSSLLFSCFVAALAAPSVDEINAKATTWKAGVNSRFENLTSAEIRTMMGVLPGKRPFVPRGAVIPANGPLPTDFDSRTAWPKCSVIATVRDQSACGSCWAFGSTEAFEDRLCIATNGAVNTLLSTEDTLSCCDSCGMGCNGGYPEAAWQYFQDSGLVAESAYPYAFPSCEHHTTGSKPPCGQEQPTPACDSSKLKGKRYYASSVYSIDGEENIQKEIMTHGTVTGAFTVYEDFVSYKSGVYQHTTGEELGGHAIKIFGWGVENGTPYWWALNSWNEDWGNHGAFKILRGSDECGIESNIVAGLVKTTA